MAKHIVEEKDETPEYEAKSHSPKFLKKAEKLSRKKKEGKKMGRKKG